MVLRVIMMVLKVKPILERRVLHMCDSNTCVWLLTKVNLRSCRAYRYDHGLRGYNHGLKGYYDGLKGITFPRQQRESCTCVIPTCVWLCVKVNL